MLPTKRCNYMTGLGLASTNLGGDDVVEAGRTEPAALWRRLRDEKRAIRGEKDARHAIVPPGSELDDVRLL